MKLLLDENLSDRMVARLEDVFPGICHCKQLGLVGAEDQEVWEQALRLGMVVVTRDRDFEQLCALRGAPPKVVWLRAGNRRTQELVELMRRSAAVIRTFVENEDAALLILTGAASDS